MPCNCVGTPTVSTPPSCPTGDNCLKLSDVIVKCADAVGPCGATGTVNVMNSGNPDKPYCHLIAGCNGGPIHLSIVDWDKNMFSSVSISGNIVTWTTTNDLTTLNKLGTIYLQACCGELASLFKLKICIKDLCQCTALTSSQSCDPCTGLPIPKLIDVSVGDSSNNIEISLV
jgi:hypothetical protein